MKKQVISMMLAGMMLLSMLGGCGKKEIPVEEETNKESTKELAPEEDAKLKFWVGGGKLNTDRLLQRLLRKNTEFL